MKVKFMPEYKGTSGVIPSANTIAYLFSEEDAPDSAGTFKLSEEKVRDIFPELLKKEEFIETDPDIFNKLREAHMQENFKSVTLTDTNGDSFSVLVERDTDLDILQVVNEAYRRDQDIYIQFKEGYEVFPSVEDSEYSVYSEDGRAHVYYMIGITQKEDGRFMSFDIPNSDFGDALSLTSIERAVTSEDPRVLNREMRSYDRAYTDDRERKLVDAQREKNASMRGNASNTADAPKQGNKP